MTTKTIERTTNSNLLRTVLKTISAGLVATALSLGGAAYAGGIMNGRGFQGTMLNGRGFQGTMLNGRGFQGTMLNCRGVQGTKQNGLGAKGPSTGAGALHVEGVTLQDGRLMSL
jgi:hypothetical protein